ncbi:MAG: hypothetical protein CVT61_00215 [Actinobacteria bacterium HGW-Actinobacteria-11]|nr:MAG: hypothetical protein CVT61_00215 [Actinobacteria bacterium HGW-Actinobacteria-11]
MSDVLDLGPIEIDEAALWWSFYPRHKDKARALAGYARARKLATAEEILAATKAFAASVEGKPASQIAFAVSWLRSEPWRPQAAPVVPPPAPTRRRRRADPSRPQRRRTTTRVRPLSAEDQKRRWCHERGITVKEYEARKHDADWLNRMKEI